MAGTCKSSFLRLNFPSCSIGLRFQSLIILVPEFRNSLEPSLKSSSQELLKASHSIFELPMYPLNYHSLQPLVHLFANQSIFSTLSKAWLKSRYSASVVFPQFIKEANQLQIEARLLWQRIVLSSLVPLFLLPFLKGQYLPSSNNLKLHSSYRIS